MAARPNALTTARHPPLDPITCMPRPSKSPTQKSNGAVIGFEAKLWLAADKLRNNMDAAEYKHVVLGLIFLKYISDAFEEMRAASSAARATTPAPTPKTRTNTAPKIFSGCRSKAAGSRSRPPPTSPISANLSMTP